MSYRTNFYWTFMLLFLTTSSFAAAPTITTPAAAAPSPVVGTTTTLTVTASDDGGEPALIYTWATTGTPPAAVAFSVNGINAAKSTVATFTKIGTYNFRVTVRDAGGLTITSNVAVVVNATLTTITISPATATVNTAATQTFAASGKNQFGAVLSPQPTFTWTATGGTITTGGVYTGGTTAGSSFNATATSGTKSGAAVVTVNTPPTVATAAACSPNPVTGTTATLSALGADNGGEPALVYTWATTGTPPAAVTFSANGTNASKSTVATFTKGGAYSLRVTIKDAGNLTVTSTVAVTVNKTLTTIVVTPATATVNTGATRAFTASGKDQFGITLSPQPTFTWTATGGTITNGGVYTAGSTAGTAFQAKATSGTKNGTAVVTVNTPPTVATAAASSPNPVTGTTSVLSALGTDNNGEAALVYTWATTGTPPAPVTFSANGTNASKSTTATFTQPGTYSLRVTIKDTANLTVTSTATVNVNSTLATVAVTPSSAVVASGSTQTFTAVGSDQFGVEMGIQPTFTWTATGGTIATDGIFTAGSTTGTTFSATATNGTKNGVATIVVTGPLPTVTSIENTSPLSKAVPFDEAEFLNNPTWRTSYLSTLEASRIWQSSEPAAGVPQLKSLGSTRKTATPGSTVTLVVQGAIGFPVTYCCMNKGQFMENGSNVITVVTDATGLATVTCLVQKGRSAVLVGSPKASGQVQFNLMGE